MKKSGISDRIRKHRVIVENFSCLALLQFFLLIYPLITYPYLVEVLGMELYGYVLTAQMLASYASLFIDFGSNYVCTKHVSINRHDNTTLSEILSNVLFLRFLIFIVAFLVFVAIVYIVPTYREHVWLFLLTYGLTVNELLFPQFFFQGIEKMKLITVINIIIKLVTIALIFIVVKTNTDVLKVPVVYSIGYLIGGIVSLYLIVYNLGIRFVRPNKVSMMRYFKDSSSIFATDLVSTIKDKLSYFLVGSLVGMSEVVVYDLGLKLHGIVAKPYMLICTVMFPRLAMNRSIRQLKLVMLTNFLCTLGLIIIANIFLKEIVVFFLHEECDLWPLRLFLLGPLFLSVSYVISNNLFIAFGYNKYMFTSILVTTSVYLVSLVVCYALGSLNTIMSLIGIALISYCAELIYRTAKALKIFKLENKKNIE